LLGPALSHHTLLHDDAESALDGHPDWSAWLKFAGATDVNPGCGSHFSHSALALQAAADGIGGALAMDVLASADIAAGRLAAPFAIKLPLSESYYVISPTAHTRLRQVAAFRTWLQQEAQAG
jgi:LysR family glycine cleavage system transcriptional activator